MTDISPEGINNSQQSVVSSPRIINGPPSNPGAVTPAFDPEISAKCGMPILEKIEIEDLLDDCDIPEVPTPAVGCTPDYDFFPPAGQDGLDGVCPSIDISTEVNVVSTGSPPNVDVNFSRTPAIDQFGNLSLDDCGYTMSFDFDLPEAECPTISLDGSISVSRSGTSPSLEIIDNSPEDCSYLYDLRFQIPCPVISVAFGATFTTDAEEIGVTTEVTEGGDCSWVFSNRFDIPCPKIKLDAKVIRGPANIHTSFPPVTTDGSTCDYDINFDFDIPCPVIDLDVVKTKGPGAIRVNRTTNVTDGDTPEDELCTYGYEIEVDFPCPTLDISAIVNTVRTFDYNRDACVRVRKVSRGEPGGNGLVNHDIELPEGEYSDDAYGPPVYEYDAYIDDPGNCENDFQIEIDIPNFCPNISIAPTRHRTLTPEMLAETGNFPQLYLEGVFHPEQCAYRIVPIFYVAPGGGGNISFQNSTIKARLLGNLYCGTDCQPAELIGSVPGAFGSGTIITVCPSDSGAFFFGEEITVHYDASSNVWYTKEGGHQSVIGISQGDYSEGDTGVFEVKTTASEAEQYVSASVKRGNSVKEDDEVELLFDELNCEWVVPPTSATGGRIVKLTEDMDPAVAPEDPVDPVSGILQTNQSTPGGELTDTPATPSEVDVYNRDVGLYGESGHYILVEEIQGEFLAVKNLSLACVKKLQIEIFGEPDDGDITLTVQIGDTEEAITIQYDVNAADSLIALREHSEVTDDPDLVDAEGGPINFTAINWIFLGELATKDITITEVEHTLDGGSFAPFVQVRLLQSPGG